MYSPYVGLYPHLQNGRPVETGMCIAGHRCLCRSTAVFKARHAQARVCFQARYMLLAQAFAVQILPEKALSRQGRLHWMSELYLNSRDLGVQV